MAISTVDDIAAGLAVSQKKRVLKNITACKAVGSMQSSWLSVGNPGAGATAPAYTAGSGYACSSATVGAIPYSNAVTQNYMAKLFATSAIAGTLRIYDRLWSCSGIPFGLGAYAITTPGTLPAPITDNGLGCELYVEQFVAAGAASGTLTANYVAPGDGAEAGVIPAVVSAPVIGQMQAVPLATGATGVKQLTSVAHSATWTSGSFGMTICKHIASVEVPLAGIGRTLNWADLGLPPIPNDACIFFIWQGGATTACQVQTTFEVIDK